MEGLLMALRRRFAPMGPTPRYAWVVLAVVVVFQIFGISVTMMRGIMVPLLQMEVADGGGFGWSPSVIGGGVAVFFLFGSLAAPLCSGLGDRLGGRWALAALALSYGLGMTLMAFMQAEWQLFLAFSVVLALSYTITVVLVMGLINPWFRNQLGLAVGIVWAGGGLGPR